MTSKELEEYFKGRALPAAPNKINSFGTVVDFEKYVQANLHGIFEEKSPYFKPCMMRLIELREWLESRN